MKRKIALAAAALALGMIPMVSSAQAPRHHTIPVDGGVASVGVQQGNGCVGLYAQNASGGWVAVSEGGSGGPTADSSTTGTYDPEDQSGEGSLC